MTISTTESRIRFSGNGATTSFSFPYYFERESHLSVYVTDGDGHETLQTIAVDYTVAGEGTSSGVVTFLEAPLATDTVTIIRDEPLIQATEVSDIGTFRAQAFENQFDRFARALQTLDGRIRRAPRVKASSGNTDVVLPEPEAKALLRWDEAATDLENGPTALDIENAEANAAIASESADMALAASTARILSAFRRQSSMLAVGWRAVMPGHHKRRATTTEGPARPPGGSLFPTSGGRHRRLTMPRHRRRAPSCRGDGKSDRMVVSRGRRGCDSVKCG